MCQSVTEQSEVQKPVGPFEDFEACVRHFEGDPDVDDPQALCGWMEENKDLAQEYDPNDGGVLEFVEELKDPDAEKVLTNLEVTYVSGVGDPAIDSQWVYAKDAADEGADWGVTSPIVLHTSKTVAVDGGGRAPVWSKADGPEDEAPPEEQKAWAPVLIPNETDKQGDVIPSDEIESAAHEFLAKYRQIDTDHDLFDGKGTPIESWTLKDSQTFTLPDGSESREYPAGTWMMGVQFSDEAWERVKAGELTGFSIYGEATQIQVEDFLAGDIEPEKAEAATPSTQAALAAKGATGTSTESNTMEDNDPEKGLTKNFDEEQAQYLGMTMESFIASTGGSLDSSLSDYLTWASEQGIIPSTITVAGEEFGGGGGGGSEETEEPETPEEDTNDGPEEETEMSNKNEGGEESPTGEEEQTGDGDEPTLKDIHDTVKETNETVKSVQDRVDDLEAEVFGKDEDGEETEPTPTEDLDEAVEEKMASILGVAKSDLPDDPEERNEVIRKHIHESRSPERDASVNPDSWEDDDFAALTEGN